MATVAPTAPAKVPAAPHSITVMATRDGTYPAPGETYPIYRNKGDIFTLAKEEHLAEGREGWMRRMTPGEIAEIEIPAAVIPQTTARGQRVAQQFPPVS